MLNGRKRKLQLSSDRDKKSEKSTVAKVNKMGGQVAIVKANRGNDKKAKLPPKDVSTQSNSTKKNSRTGMEQNKHETSQKPEEVMENGNEHGKTAQVTEGNHVIKMTIPPGDKSFYQSESSDDENLSDQENGPRNASEGEIRSSLDEKDRADDCNALSADVTLTPKTAEWR